MGMILGDEIVMGIMGRMGIMGTIPIIPITPILQISDIATIPIATIPIATILIASLPAKPSCLPLLLLIAIFQSCLCHSFTHAAVFNELLFQSFELLV